MTSVRVLTGLSLIAESPDGNIVGACLNACHVSGHVDETEAEVERCPNPKFQKILRLLASLERQADVFGKFPEVRELLEIRIVAVDANWRGKGVATSLLKQTKSVFCAYSIFDFASS
jgi:GNAT superfamily N-acetyltransferase